MFKVVALSGSLRAGSSNRGLVNMAIRLAPTELAFEVYEGATELPFYNPDLDAEDRVPAAAVAWRELVSSADGLFLAAPEYNFGPTAVLKNAVDWATRPFATRPLQGKVITIVSSGGGAGGKRSQTVMASILEALGNTLVMEPEVAIFHGGRIIGADGVADPEIEALISQRLANFLEALRVRSDEGSSPTAGDKS
jgi:NAD(P)H-dependent FMN reductase